MKNIYNATQLNAGRNEQDEEKKVLYVLEAYHVLMVCKFLQHDVIQPNEVICVDRIECVDCNGECPKTKIRGKITPYCWRLK